MESINKFLERVGRSVGGVVGALYQAGREAIDQVIVNILPFMAFIALVIGIAGMPYMTLGRSEADQHGLPSKGRALWPACQSCWNSFMPVGRTASTSRR